MARGSITLCNYGIGIVASRHIVFLSPISEPPICTKPPFAIRLSFFAGPHVDEQDGHRGYLWRAVYRSFRFFSVLSLFSRPAATSLILNLVYRLYGLAVLQTYVISACRFCR